jgi:heterotetrameric sarcosine oxidase gamma subunit
MSPAILSPLSPAKVAPFGASMAQRRPNREGLVQVHLCASTLVHLTQFSTWIGGWPALAARLGPLMPVPASTGQTARQGEDWIARTGPDELWLIGAHGSALCSQATSALTPDIGHALDLSHARCRLSVQGAGAVPTLQKLFALDFREAAFGVNEVRLSGAHHLPALLHRTASDAFDLYVHTTYAHDQVESVLDAALEWGAELTLLPA